MNDSVGRNATVEPADYILDVCGESCPYPVIHTLEALRTLKPGETMEVTTDCPQSYRNVPDDAVAAGHELIGEPYREGPTMHMTFRRGKKILGKQLTDAKKRAKSK